MRYAFIGLILLIAVSIYGKTMSDTLDVFENTSGVLRFNIEHNMMEITFPPNPFLVGDGWHPFDSYFFASYMYLSFETPEIPFGWEIIEANLRMYCFSRKGNDQPSTYPIFDPTNGYPYNPYLMLDHIYYGSSLDYSDLEISPNQLTPTVYLQNYMDTGWFSIDVTEFLIDDINESRDFSQYRLRLQNDSDWDVCHDNLEFEVSPGYKVHIQYLISNGVSVSDDTTSEVQEEIDLTASPNPFNPSTEISFSLDRTKHVRITVFNHKGQVVTILHDGFLSNGQHRIAWNGKDSSNNPVASGIYLFCLESDGETVTKKITLLK